MGEPIPRMIPVPEWCPTRTATWGMCWISVEAGKENIDSMEALKAGLNTTDPEWVAAFSTDDYIQAWTKLWTIFDLMPNVFI